ncbi:FMN-binding protein [Limnobacter sp.]|uniref:FMN-binding protein n=1 Tax=Limnobacter sp. TaxID=2003368 RepID=UPI00258E736B|nr:FMN-binding protein [Limnobacter sp.]
MKHAWASTVLLTTLSQQAHAVQYLNTEQAQKALFPQATGFTEQDWLLTPKQLAAVEQLAGQRPNNPHVRVLKAQQGQTVLGYVVLDSVIGKYDLIDYAVGLNADATVKQIEIMAYRESHGFEIRSPAWRAQFAGKSASHGLRVGDGIANISGATLSCTHVTDGVRRIAAVAQVMLRP